MLLKMGRFLETPNRQTPILQTRLISIGNKTDTVSIYPPATHPRYATGRAGRYRPALRPGKGSRPPARGAPPKRDLPREQGLPDPRPSYPSAGGVTRPGAVSPPHARKKGSNPQPAPPAINPANLIRSLSSHRPISPMHPGGGCCADQSPPDRVNRISDRKHPGSR